jgi:CheY-like chemotaxis protein
VAEDNTLVRELLMAFLVESGAEATYAADGVTALTMAREHKPDVLLLDIALPRMDGIAVAQALRRDGPPSLRIIGLSAHVSPHDEALARQAGMNGFLAKPVRLANLAAAILEQVQGHDPAPDTFGRIGDERLRSRLTAQFAHETPRLFAEMRAAVAMSDWSGVQRNAHYLKNSADVLGMRDLQKACQRVAVIHTPPDATAALNLVQAMESAIPAQLSVLAIARHTEDR